MSAIGVVAAISQVIIRTNIQSQKFDEMVVNLSGRQRMLSQRLTKDFLLLERAHQDSARHSLIGLIRRHHLEWRSAHLFLSDQSDNQGKKMPNSTEVRNLFNRIQPSFDSIDHACVLITRFARLPSPDLLAKSLQIILASESQFLHQMENITYRFEMEAAERVMYLERVEFVLFLVTILILAIESLFVLLPAVKNMRLYFQKMLQANKSLEKSALELHESRRLLLSSSFEAQERERKRIAMELHDGLGPLIALTKMNINHLQGKVSEPEARYVDKSLKMLDEIHQGIQQISGDLMPYALEQFGLEIALENLVEEVQLVASARLKLYCNLEQFTSDKTFELNIYRLVQELLTNAVRHSGATEIAVQVFTDEARVVIMIEDDGKGLDSDNPLQSTGLGLKNMLSRVNAFNGYLNIDTAPSDGTTITIYLPVTN